MKSSASLSLVVIVTLLLLMPEPTLSDCPNDFFKFNDSYRCFTIFKDKARNWNDAEKKCRHEGLRMPTNTDKIAEKLRKYLISNTGSIEGYWLSATGDGDNGYVWRGPGRRRQGIGHIPLGSHLWYNGPPERPSNYSCLMLDVRERRWDNPLNEAPGQPYVSWNCEAWYFTYTLCEVVRSNSNAPVIPVQGTTALN